MSKVIVGGCRNDGFVEALQIARGHIGFGVLVGAVGNNADEVDLMDASDKNQYHWDDQFDAESYCPGDSLDVTDCNEDEHKSYSAYLQQSVDEEASTIREAQLLLLHYEATNHSFYAYERHFGASVDKRTVRSEAFTVIQARSTTKGDMPYRRKPVFYGHLQVR